MTENKNMSQEEYLEKLALLEEWGKEPSDLGRALIWAATRKQDDSTAGRYVRALALEVHKLRAAYGVLATRYESRTAQLLTQRHDLHNKIKHRDARVRELRKELKARAAEAAELARREP